MTENQQQQANQFSSNLDYQTESTNQSQLTSENQNNSKETKQIEQDLSKDEMKNSGVLGIKDCVKVCVEQINCSKVNKK